MANATPDRPNSAPAVVRLRRGSAGRRPPSAGPQVRRVAGARRRPLPTNPRLRRPGRRRAAPRRRRRPVRRARCRPGRSGRSPPPCRSRITCGSAAPGRAVPLLGDVRRDDQADAEQGVVVVLEPASRTRASHGVDGRPERVGHRAPVGRRGRSQRVGSAGRPAQRDHPEPDRSTSRAAKSSSHAVHRSSYPGVPVLVAAVADPGLGVLAPGPALALDHPGVEAGPVEPRRPASRQVCAVAGLPVAENRATPPGSRWSPTVPTSSRTTASPTRPPSRYSYGDDARASRRDDERRVAHDEVEPFARDRVEEVPGPQVDRHLGERRGEPGEGERAARRGRWRRPCRCARRGAGPGPRNRCRGRGPALPGGRGASTGRRSSRRPDAEDVVRGRGRTVAGDLGLVRHDPPVVGLVAVGAKVAERSRVAGAELDEPQRSGPDRGQAGQGAVEVGRGDRHTEREATRQDGGRVPDPAGGQVGGQWLLPVQCRVRDRPEEAADSVDRVAGAGQIRAEGRPGPRRPRAAAGATRAAARLTVCRWRRRGPTRCRVGPAFGAVRVRPGTAPRPPRRENGRPRSRPHR